ncbi:acyl-CoA dehydrogenase family protein [Streptomyces europaeiscabiei]|uniref:acyl-CoA dehydrogenase family protein n=1 Tax=Streptomyces europaeiscabiei TaxID=146819 RepID=UPI000E6A115F|nr:acyl-CoA dehydrogenase [Streptomyces europaeiscabiei]MDX2769035.1 acyl-CoA dehydrogenase [Streptomyces europaeiscabiei]MDX3716011.1 acyl-CoA dehydrogenase [Streptomyces europaeiscabiei]MDX3867701.1 acyl-CoA dehydrogenase [Streptomyces europaeiscabiei]MDX3876271.1 acyl-CoA dehydrogenase [Streptomyces europaeiscabiei]
MTAALLPGHLPSGTVVFPSAEDSCRSERTARTPQQPHRVLSGELARLLFDEDSRTSVHAPWRGLLTDERFHHRPGLTPEQRVALSYDRLRQVNEVIDFPEQLARDPERLAALHEWTGVVDGGLCTLASIHYNLFLGSLLDHENAGRDLSEFTSMRRTGTFLCTELDHGNDAPALQTTAELDRETGEFVLNTPTAGAQKFMPNTSLTGGPKTAVVAARLLIDGEDQGVYLFLTPLSDDNGHLPGVRVRRLPNRTGTPVDHCLTAFDHVRLPREALLQADHGRLDAHGTFTSTMGSPRKRFLQSIDRVTTGKLCMSAGTLGMARASLVIAVRHAHSRQVSGPRRGLRVPLMAHRSHHGRLLHSLTLAYAMTFLHRSVLTRWVGHSPEDREDTARLVAVAKGWITWQARAITTESRERCGAQGFFPVNGISDLPSNVEGGITAEGDNLVIWLKAASEMLFDRQDDDRPAAGGTPGDRPLTDLSFLRELLAEVVTGWQSRARDALRQGPKGDPLGRWNEASAPALEMVSAYACLQAADAFTAAAARAEDPEARRILEELCRLFLLQQLSAHSGLLLADNHMTAEHVRSLWSTVNGLVARLAPHTMALADAFDLPAEFLATVPIAGGGRISHEHCEQPGGGAGRS